MIGEREDQLRKDIENDEAWLDTECDRIQQAAQAHWESEYGSMLILWGIR